jgi:predicted kinase
MSKSIYRIGDSRRRPLSDPRPDDPPIVAALRYGVTAPSAHNTQPWRIELASDVEARLFFDPNRMLPHTDPLGRQVHISHGTLIEMTSIAATSLGFRTEVDVLPDGDISIPEFGTKPTATIRLAPEPGIQVDPLFSQILERRSSRLAHQGPPLTEQERARIERNAHIPGVEVGWIPEDQLARVLTIAVQAMTTEVEDEDRDLYDETRIWFRFSDREIAEKGDGLHADTVGLSGLSLALGRRFINDGNWHKPYNRGPYLKGFRRSVSATTALLTLTTATNTMRDWITTGRAYVRAQLSAGSFGLRFQPISQVLQEFPQMDQLRTEMEQLVGITAPAKLQMLVRVGRTTPPALSPRRDLRAIIQQ